MEHPEKARATSGAGSLAIRARGLWAGYPGREVLREVDLEVRSGELCALIGPNGAGKSTLLRALAGLIVPTRGRVDLDERPVADFERQALARRVAMVHQSAESALGFSVREVVLMGRAPHLGAWMRASAADVAIAAAAMATCRLEAIADRPVRDLSGGEQKRVTMARALAQQADVLLLDEPGAHLDIRATIELFDVVRREVEERSIACVAVLHDLELAAHHADHVLVLKEGRVVAAGPPSEVMTDARLGEAFDTDLSVGVDPTSGRRYFLPLRARS